MKTPKIRCSVKACCKPPKAKTFCCTHYQRYRKHGKHFDRSLVKPISLVNKFKRKMSKKDINGCIEIPGETDEYGYVKFYFTNEKYMVAHRVSYLLFVGEIIPKFYVCHTCDNIRCVNPEHLVLGNFKDHKVDREKGIKNEG